MIYTFNYLVLKLILRKLAKKMFAFALVILFLIKIIFHPHRSLKVIAIDINSRFIPLLPFSSSISCCCTLRKLCFYFLSLWMGYDRGDSFCHQNHIPFTMKGNGNIDFSVCALLFIYAYSTRIYFRRKHMI